jgi:hypothetical protein
MNNSYKSYLKLVNKLMNGNSESYKKAVNKGLVIERKVNMNGEPYRFLTEQEWERKSKPKN